jgi:hypothetical protein
MQIRKLTLPILVVLVLGLAASSFGQSVIKKQSLFQSPHPQLGYYDPTTGAFTPLKPAVADPEATSTTSTVTGEFVFTITITVKSTFPKNGIVGCSAHLVTEDVTTGLSYGETGSVLATGSGTSWTCKITIPYSWILTTATLGDDEVELDYDASISEVIQGTATNGTSTAVDVIPARDSGHGLGTIKLPASGATTTETIAVTL